jgi:hypothetical protein
LALSKVPARMGIRSHVQGANIPSKGILSIQEVYAWPELIYNMCVYDITENIPCVQVKNKPHVGEWKHVYSWLNGLCTWS